MDSRWRPVVARFREKQTGATGITYERITLAVGSGCPLPVARPPPGHRYGLRRWAGGAADRPSSRGEGDGSAPMAPRLQPKQPTSVAPRFGVLACWLPFEAGWLVFGIATIASHRFLTTGTSQNHAPANSTDQSRHNGFQERYETAGSECVSLSLSPPSLQQPPRGPKSVCAGGLTQDRDTADSYSLPGASLQGRRRRIPVDPVLDPAHGCHLHAQPLHWMVSSLHPCTAVVNSPDRPSRHRARPGLGSRPRVSARRRGAAPDIPAGRRTHRRCLGWNRT